MHGLIFAELERFVEVKLGLEGWARVQDESGVGRKLYLTAGVYPDEEIVALASTAARIAGAPLPGVLEDFGEALVPAYLKLYGHRVQPEWRALDLLEHTEETIHKTVRANTPGAAPPELRAIRVREDEVLIHYASERKLCPVLKGIVRGVARHYGEALAVSEQQCMLEGAEECEISIVAE